MHTRSDDRLGTAATCFVRVAGERVRAEAASAVECWRHGSMRGVRYHLTSLRAIAERRARIERHLLRTSSGAARLRRAADAALDALDVGSPARLTRALARVEALAQWEGAVDERATPAALLRIRQRRLRQGQGRARARCARHLPARDRLGDVPRA